MCGAPVAAYLRWNSLGVSPTSSRNRLLNEPRLENPTAWQTSVTVRLVARSRSWARSTRRRERCAAGVSAVRRGEQPLEVVLAHPGDRRPASRGRAARCSAGRRGRGPGAGGPGRRPAPARRVLTGGATSRRRSSASRASRALSRSRREAMTAARKASGGVPGGGGGATYSLTWSASRVPMRGPGLPGRSVGSRPRNWRTASARPVGRPAMSAVRAQAASGGGISVGGASRSRTRSRTTYVPGGVVAEPLAARAEQGREERRHRR